jgi:hypothetical protein
MLRIAFLTLPLVGFASSSVAAQRVPPTPQEQYSRATGTLKAATDDQARFYALRRAAKAAFEVGQLAEARAFAKELLDLAGRLPRDWNYGNAIHDGHLVLGRLAVRDGDVETAKRELLEAGRTPGSPQLDSFGPNMSLARDLIEKGQVEVVLQYFELCSKFWDHRDDLRRWSVQAKAGEIPDFGANLVY